MLKIVREDEFRFRVDKTNGVIVCAKALTRENLMMIISLENEERIAFRVSNKVVLESYGALYIKNSTDFRIEAKNVEKDDVKFMVTCSNALSGKRMIEVFELNDGTLAIAYLVRGILIESVNREQLMSQLN